MKIFRVYLISIALSFGLGAYADSHQNELALLTFLKLKPGTEAKFMTEVNKIVKPSLAEPGNIAWYVQQSTTDSSTIVFYTRWKNEEALQTHLKSKPLVDYIAETAPLLEPGYPKLVRFQPIDQIRDALPDGSAGSDNCKNCDCCP